jgi:F-type H+-transporting ATPase subunit delta
MGVYNISNRYANALIELAEEKKAFDKISEDIQIVYNTLTASKELRVMLASPVIKESDKTKILVSIFEKHISKDSLNFLRFIVERNREEVLFHIVKRYLELRDIKLGIVNVELKSAAGLNDKQKSEMKSKLTMFSGKKVRIKFTTDESLIGGFIAKIGDTVLDASIVRQLELLRQSLLSDKKVSVI